MTNELEVLAGDETGCLIQINNLLMNFDFVEGSVAIDYGDAVGVFETVPLWQGIELLEAFCNQVGGTKVIS